ncbi:carbohydrate ABC transporter permease [Mediterraneibacter gnavus]|uniref:Carbohydrate ABC transporter permease n=1 Tax=Mediterraneibacter gnavus TaxID=33038 RepID=A0A9Q6AMS3_MEDGN|nr:carbohydrate ABC transporter permease [Mediterraneibacter gnavus]MBS5544116.1 carbohydrate ABC transporter permease [Ruminococcus sp.]MCZ0641293.1 carbohydrate ABC transporter permease [Mediterraneibacter gnavus]MCZ0668955.1 carbohydrate ABC transporter permease [Mediterraneibacter gnavus]MCZ0689914.1 carbohydrate ABC transporter permease [Mediterraneibacter gnavus]NSI53213.1 carbohydrate ABC transporter permease [Mediterraneibacter gnavus]
MNRYVLGKGIVGAGRWILLAIVSFLILFPVLWIFVSSITPPGELFKTPIDYIPDHPTLDSYTFLIENVGLFEKIGNTILIVGVTLIVSTIISAMAAYAFSRFKSKGIQIAFAFILATMLIPEIVTARPLYEFMQKTGLYDTYPGLILLYISGVVPFTVLILTNFVKEIPVSLEEAAAIDGATFLQRLFYVVLPLLKPAIATVCIINFITCLNNFFTPLYYSNGIQVLSVSIVQLPLRDNMYGVPWDLVSAMGWIILLPIIIFVAIFEKQIMDGIMAGGVKA